ncbi:MAG: PTS sugar transporter subunit IIA [Polyangiaceae bacterium]|nr:PTS sugar transporter subunit IIA [Polyangiaceae bacterium]
MQVVDILSPLRVAVSRNGADPVRTKQDVLKRLSDLLSRGEPSLDAGAIERMLLRREEQQSTGVGGGVAIPHAAIEELDHIVGAVLLCPDPVGFDAIDGLPVSIFFAVIGPRRAVGEHLKTLARVSRLLRDDHFRKSLVEAPNGPAAFDLIAREEGRPP